MTRLLRWLFWRSDCDLCGAHDPRTMHGTWWHDDGCPNAGPYDRKEGCDDE